VSPHEPHHHLIEIAVPPRGSSLSCLDFWSLLRGSDYRRCEGAPGALARQDEGPSHRAMRTARAFSEEIGGFLESEKSGVGSPLENLDVALIHYSMSLGSNC
jgi:hypothetical protein